MHIRNWLRSLGKLMSRFRPATRVPRRARSTCLALDSLEDRITPVISLSGYDATFGTVTFTGDAADDTLQLAIDAFGKLEFTANGGPAETDLDPITPGIQDMTVGVGTARLISVDLGAGTNSLTINDSWLITHKIVFTGSGTDTLYGNNTSNAWQLSGDQDGDLTLGADNVQFLDVETLIAGSGSDTLTGETLARTWTVDVTSVYNPGANQITLSGFDTFQGGTDVDTFNAVGNTNINLLGGAGADIFNIGDLVSLSGSLDGEGGTDTLSYASGLSPVAVTLTGSAADGFIGSDSFLNVFQGMDILTGTADLNDFLFGEDVVSTWTVDNTSTYDDGSFVLTISAFDYLVGGNMEDTFDLTPLTAHPITIFGQDPPLPSFPGDVLNIDTSGTTNPFWTPYGPDSGEFTFDAPHQMVTYFGIETPTILADDCTVTMNLDMVILGFEDGNADVIDIQINDSVPFGFPNERLHVLIGPPAAQPLGLANLFVNINFAPIKDILLTGSPDDELLIVNGVDGNPIPCDGITFNGGMGTDEIRVIGATILGGTSAIYTPDSTTTGDGVIDVTHDWETYYAPTPPGPYTLPNTRTISFTGTENTVEISGMTSLTLITPNDADALSLDTALGFGSDDIATFTATEITGSSGIVGIDLRIFNVTSFLLDGFTNDAGSADTITINGDLPTHAQGLQNLTIDTGTGNDLFTLNANDYDLAVGGGTFIFNADAGLDRVVANLTGAAAVDFNLSETLGGVGTLNTSLTTTTIGITLNGMSGEEAYLNGNSGVNRSNISDWRGTARLQGNAGADELDLETRGGLLELEDIFFLVDNIDATDLPDGPFNTATITSTTPGSASVGLNLNSGTRTITVANGGPNPLEMLIDVQIIGTGSLDKSGAGDLQLAGMLANTFSGTTTVNDGTLQLNKTAGIDAVPHGLVIGDGVGADDSAVVVLLQSNQITATLLSGNGVAMADDGLFDLNGLVEEVGFVESAGGATLNLATVQLTGGTAHLLTGSQKVTHTFVGQIIGAGMLTKNGVTTWILTGDHTYDGTTTINAGTVVLSGSMDAGGTIFMNGLLADSTVLDGVSTGTIADRTIQVNAGTENVTIRNLASTTKIGGTAIIVLGGTLALPTLISNNNITTSDIGVSISAGGIATLEDNTIQLHTTYGVLITGVLGVSPDSRGNLDGNIIQDNAVGVWVEAEGEINIPQGSTANQFIDNDRGLVVKDYGSNIVGLTLRNTQFSTWTHVTSSAAFNYIELLVNAHLRPDLIDCSGCYFDIGFGLQLANTMTTAELNTLDSKLIHYPDDSGVGLLILKTNIAYQDPNGNLVVIGSNARNTITVNSTKPTATTVTLNGRPAGTFNISASTRRIIIFAMGEADNIQVTGTKNSDVFGGEGNDTIYGGDGNDVLRGEGDNDFINGRNGNDMLIGGLGQDTLSGGAGHDFLIGGDTIRSYDDLYSDLSMWFTPPSRTQALLNSILANYTGFEAITDDMAVDRLTGDAGQDGMAYSASDILPDFTMNTDWKKIVP